MAIPETSRQTSNTKPFHAEESSPSSVRKRSISILLPKEKKHVELKVFDWKEIKLGKLLGKGAFSKVYEVTYSNNSSRRQRYVLNRASQQENPRKVDWMHREDKTDVKSYAIKLPRNSSKNHTNKKENNNISQRDTISLEANFLASLHHENIVQVHGIVEVSNNSQFSSLFVSAGGKQYGYIMDLLLDYTLYDKIIRWEQLNSAFNHNQDRKYMLPLRTKYAVQMAKALAYLHKHRIIFRDLKPQNIGFQDEENIKLIDFGVCRKLPPSLKERKDGEEGCYYRMSLSGTPRYMAPEILRRCKYNTKADVYSWAMVFYAMLALKQPYMEHDREDMTIMVGHQGMRPKLSRLGLPKKINKILRYAWNQYASERYTMVDVCRKLECVLEELERENLVVAE